MITSNHNTTRHNVSYADEDSGLDAGSRAPLQPATGRRDGLNALLLVALATIAVAACSVSSSTQAPVSPTASAALATSATPAAASASAVAATSATPPTAAGATPPALRGAGTFDACAMLTTSDLSKVFGNGKVQARSMPSGGWVAGQCAWSAPNAGFEISVGTAASFQKFGDPMAPNAKEKLAAFVRQANGLAAKPKDVAGIGDGAVLAKTGMAAYKGTTYLEALNLGLTDEQLLQIVKMAVASL